MHITTQQVEIQAVQADTIIVNLFEGVRSPTGATQAVDKALEGAISEVIESGDFNGRLGETLLLYSRAAIPARRVIVVGLGQPDGLTLETVREAAGAAIKRAERVGARHVATIVHGGGGGGLAVTEAAQAVVEGSLLALYRYDTLRTKDDDSPLSIEHLTVVEWAADKLADVDLGVSIGRVVAESVSLTRTLVNQPSNLLNPTTLAQATQEMCHEVGLVYRVLEEAEMRAHGMGALLAVTQGATQPAKFITIENRPAKSINEKHGPIVLIGKGVTFDTGGYSLKPKDSMTTMKADMAGGAAVIGAMRAIALLKLPLHVVGLIPAVENVVGANAYRPGEVFIAKNGLSIEIISTDAEGRLILADALCYADTLRPSLVIDVATLTGGKAIGLGYRYNALFCEDFNLSQTLLQAAYQVAEPLWPMPLDEAYDRDLKSSVADLKNNGGRYGSAITAARFLNHFTGHWPWAHLDVAGSALYRNRPEDTPRSYLVEGASGIPTRTLIAFLRQWEHEAPQPHAE